MARGRPRQRWRLRLISVSRTRLKRNFRCVQASRRLQAFRRFTRCCDGAGQVQEGRAADTAEVGARASAREENDPQEQAAGRLDRQEAHQRDHAQDRRRDGVALQGGQHAASYSQACSTGHPR